jgi:hypothetical protein
MKDVLVGAAAIGQATPDPELAVSETDDELDDDALLMFAA